MITMVILKEDDDHHVVVVDAEEDNDHDDDHDDRVGQRRMAVLVALGLQASQPAKPTCSVALQRGQI